MHAYHDESLGGSVESMTWRVSFDSRKWRMTFLTVKVPSGNDRSHCHGFEDRDDVGYRRHSSLTAYFQVRGFEPAAVHFVLFRSHRTD